MKKTVLAGIVVTGLAFALSGCGPKAIELNKDATVAYDPAKDKPSSPMGGPGSKGGKGKKGAAAPGGGGAPGGQ
jgi:hypothetical protein